MPFRYNKLEYECSEILKNIADDIKKGNTSRDFLMKKYVDNLDDIEVKNKIINNINVMLFILKK